MPVFNKNFFLTDIYWFQKEGILLLAFAFIFSLFAFLLNRFMKKAEKRKRFSRVIEAVMLPAYFFTALLFLYFFAGIVDEAINTSPLLPVLSIVLPILGVVFLLWTFFRVKNVYVERAVERTHTGKGSMHIGQIHTLNKLITALALFVAIILMLKAFGYDASILLTIGGIGGAFVGFATKDFIANFFGGLVIYLTQPFTIGDMIKLHERGIEGNVEEIGWYLTKIIDSEKQPVHIPNSMFSQVILITPSKRSHHRIKETVQVRPQDFDKIPAIIENLKRELSDLPYIDSNQRLEIHFLGADRYQMSIEILAYTKDIKPYKYKEVIQSVLFKARECIIKQGAGLPGGAIEIEWRLPLSVNLNTTDGQS